MKDEKMDCGREEGLRKYALIAPLLEEGVPAFEMARRRSLLREQQGISERTLRRWVAAYRKGGFEALVKAPRKDKGLCKALSPEVLALAEACRKELPRRSAGLIHDWLKHQGHTVARSTLERHLRQRGLSGRALMAQGATPGAGRRFVRIGRNTLWQADMKYGPFIPSPGGGKKQRTHLMAGQTELKDRLKLQIHQAIAGRVDLRFHLGPLTAEETMRYVRSHLEAVKSPGEIFTQAAVAMLYEHSGGIPRKINKVATACLMSAACSQSRLVDDHMVRVVVASEFEI